MKNRRPVIDGFIPRRTGNELGEFHDSKKQEKKFKNEDRGLLHTGQDKSRQLGSFREDMAIGKSDVDESLDAIDKTSTDDKDSKNRGPRALKFFKRPGRTKKIVKWSLIGVLIVGLGLAAYLVTKVLLVEGNIFKGSILDIVQSVPLKQDSNGRSNFLIVGTSEDDPGHPGANLTDSIMVLSVDQNKKNAYMFSVPRDLEVQYGEACLPGYSGKINAYFSCADDGTNKEAEQNRLAKTRALVGGIFGIDLQYGIHVNYSVMRDVVNALGGSIVVNIESRDPRGQMDANFDWKCGASYYERIKRCPPNGHFIDYPNGPATLDAEHALYLAQARGESFSYGFSQSNFDREKNQQKILVAIRDKALSVGALTNISTITKLIDALGNNLKTDIQTNEIRTLAQLASDIKAEDIHSISLIDGDNPVMNGSGNPSAGLYNYADIREFIKKKLSSNDVIREEAPIVVLNGSSIAGAAQIEADKLAQKEFTLLPVGNAPKGSYGEYEIYVIDATKTGTLEALKGIYPAAVVKTTKPPMTVSSEASFVLILGSTSS